MAKIFEMCDVWGDGNKEYTAIKMNVKDNDSEDSSKLLELLLDGVSKFAVDKDGIVTAEGYENLPAEIMISGSPETKELEVGNNAFKFVMPYSMQITEIRTFLSSGPVDDDFEADLNIDIATVPLVISHGGTYQKQTVNVTAPNETIVSLDIEQVGSTYAGAGLKVTLIGKRL